MFSILAFSPRVKQPDKLAPDCPIDQNVDWPTGVVIYWIIIIGLSHNVDSDKIVERIKGFSNFQRDKLIETVCSP